MKHRLGRQWNNPSSNKSGHHSSLPLHCNQNCLLLKKNHIILNHIKNI